MNLYEAIKTDMTRKDIARLLVAVDANVPKMFACDTFDCRKCKEDFVCFDEFLNTEVEVKK